MAARVRSHAGDSPRRHRPKPAYRRADPLFGAHWVYCAAFEVRQRAPVGSPAVDFMHTHLPGGFMDSINSRIAEELGVRPQQVEAAVALLDEGSTVPFIARYRKEVTGSLDDTQLRHLEERLRYLRELDERRISILASIEEQGKLTPELARDIKLADTKTRLEDLYLPYKQKRRTKGQIALEAGLGELADGLFNDPTLTPETEAARFVDAEKGFADVKAVLEGAKYILMERFAEDATLLEKLRSFLKHEAV